MRPSQAHIRAVTDHVQGFPELALGLDKIELTKTENNMSDLVSEYQQHVDAKAEKEGRFEMKVAYP